MELLKKLGNRVLIFDGAMGTMLQTRSLKLGELPEVLNIKNPELIRDIHKLYIDAGADIITSNTFGANERKLGNTKYSVEEVIDKAIENARLARAQSDVAIALDIGPIGELLEPMGSLSFEEAYEIFKRQVVQGVKSGADLVIIETMTDLYEMKAAVLAVKENSQLPVFATMSFEEDKRTFTGSSVESMVVTLEGLGVDALGINCSLGPKEIEPILDDILKITQIPVMVQANAGLPTMVEGRTVYNINEEEFAAYGKDFVQKGVSIIGGCCGTTDRYISLLVDKIGDCKVVERKIKALDGVCTPTKFLSLNQVRVIGERINPTGKRAFKEALKKNDMEYILKEAISQQEEGAHILDVNVGLPEIDEEKLMVRAIKEIQSILDIPLQIDSTNPRVIESGLRVYNGKAIVNSVNGEDAILDKILPIVKKYGAAVVGLTLDEKGIPSKAEERLAIARKIVKRAEDYGIDKKDIYIDCLTLTVAAQQEDVVETLKAVTLVKKELGVKTVLGVSNISFGLPRRDLINNTFLSAALYAGLDMPIINPANRDMMETIKSSNLLWNYDKGGKSYIKHFESLKTSERSEIQVPESKLDLSNIITKGIKEEARLVTRELLKSEEALDIVNNYIMPALDQVGNDYERGSLFLPQLIQSAETVKVAFEEIKAALARDNKEQITRGRIILATVKGDIHDIGKNIVKVLLENYNYEIIDLGKDVSPDRILEEAKSNDVKLIGLSALMTTTVKSMEETISLLKDNIPDIIIMVGGAVLDENYSKSIGADYYGNDAKKAVEIASRVFA